MSELYELPEGWEWKKLDDIANFQNGFAFKSKEFNTENKGLQIIRIGNVLDINKNPVYIDKREAFRKYLLIENDIVISMTGTRNKRDYLFVRIVKTNDSYLNQRVGKITNNEKSYSKYLYYFLKSNCFRDKIFEYETGAVNQGNISAKDIMNSNIPYVNLKEQKRIVSKLDTLFEKIDKAIELHEKNIKEADAFMGSVLNEVFEELEEKYQIFKVGEITDCIVPQRNKPKQFIGEIPWVTTDDLKLFKGILKSTKGLGLRKKEILESKSKIIPKNSVIMSCVGDLGIVAIADNDIVVNQQLHTFQCKESLLNIYLMYALYVKKDFMYHIANITTVAYMNKTKCNSIPLPLPPLNVQQKTVNYLDKVSQKIEKTKAIQKEKLQNLKDLKASILDQAFKGEL